MSHSVTNPVTIFTLLFICRIPGTLASFVSLLQAPAPAPAGGQQPAADGAFIFTASSVQFSNSTALQLNGVPNVTQWLSYPPNPQAGSFQTALFFSKALESPNQDWAGGPQALLQGAFANATSSSILLTLHAPIYSASQDLVTMAYRILPTDEAALPERGGVVDSALQSVASASVGSGQRGFLASAAPGTILLNVMVVLDVVNIVQYTGVGVKDGVVPAQLDSDLFIGDPYYGFYEGR